MSRPCRVIFSLRDQQTSNGQFIMGFFSFLGVNQSGSQGGTPKRTGVDHCTTVRTPPGGSTLHYEMINDDDELYNTQYDVRAVNIHPVHRVNNLEPGPAPCHGHHRLVSKGATSSVACQFCNCYGTVL
jgi:hypothetical protein